MPVSGVEETLVDKRYGKATMNVEIFPEVIGKNARAKKAGVKRESNFYDLEYGGNNIFN